VVVSTIIFSDRRMFEQLVNSFPGRVVASIDFRGTSVSISGWTTEYPVLPEVAAAECDYLPLHSLIATDVSVEGRLTGIDIAGVRRIRKVVKHPLIVAGGVSGVDDLMALRRCGADGAILGRILYGQRSSFMKLVEGFRNKM
ncbi:MAG: hypothetical protein KIY12_02605, partial [Thermoplasmata archaeon]|nr:hypothetical protein [Candidatus Sysuiplasma superficiale]